MWSRESNCLEVIMSDQSYCHIHKCHDPKCKNSIIKFGKFYCNIHGCSHPDCNFPGMWNGKNVACPVHTCQYATLENTDTIKCNNLTNTGKIYCSDHLCNFPGCNFYSVEYNRKRCKQHCCKVCQVTPTDEPITCQKCTIK